MTNTFDKNLYCTIISNIRDSQATLEFFSVHKDAPNIHRFSNRRCVLAMCTTGNLEISGVPLSQPVLVFTLILYSRQQDLPD